MKAGCCAGLVCAARVENDIELSVGKKFTPLSFFSASSFTADFVAPKLGCWLIALPKTFAAGVEMLLPKGTVELNNEPLLAVVVAGVVAVVFDAVAANVVVPNTPRIKKKHFIRKVVKFPQITYM